MINSRKNRLAPLVGAVALVFVAAACSSDDEGAAVGQTPTTQETATTTTASTVVESSTTESTTPESTATPPQAPSADISSFEPFPLPDYAAAVVDADYSSYLVEVEPGVNVHVLEVGSGYPVYLQHGAPTSGFLYRQVAELLPLDQFRVIMPTMVGLGFSSQVPAEQHTLDNHARWMNETLNQLELDDLIFVGHDWGGPVGLGALERSPELLAGAVLLNTAIGAPTGPVELNPQLQAILAPLPDGALPTVTANIFAQLPLVQSDPASMSPDVVDLYRRPVVESDSPVGPIGPLSILRMTATGPEHPTAEVLRAIDAYVAQLDVPAEIVWGLNDPVLGARLPAMAAAFPNAPITETDSGHFLQEEADSPAEIAAAIQRVHEEALAQ